jgi:hypothetical protein
VSQLSISQLLQRRSATPRRRSADLTRAKARVPMGFGDVSFGRMAERCPWFGSEPAARQQMGGASFAAGSCGICKDRKRRLGSDE